MPLSGLDIDDANAAAVASTLIRVFREGASSLVEEQVAKCADKPGIAMRWEAIGKAIQVMSEANAYMEAALEMLDSVEEQQSSVHLDHAIATLGIRADTPLTAGQPKTLM